MRRILVTSALPNANGAIHLRPPVRAHPDRHLGALSAHDGQRVLLRLRRRRPRHGNHARGGTVGHHRGGHDRVAAPGARRGLPALPRRPRQLLLDALAGERTPDPDDLRTPRPGRPDVHRRCRAALRPGAQAVPGRPVRQGHLSTLRGRRPVRRQLPGVRRHLRRHRAGESALHLVRQHPGTALVGPLFLRPGAIHRLPPGVDGKRCGPAGGGEQARRMADRRPEGLGHQPRRAVFRVHHPRYRGQVLLCLDGCAHRLHGELREPMRPDRRPGSRRLLAPGQRSRSPPLHRQGHHQLPLPVLAGGAAGRRLPHADQGAHPRLHHGGRRQDVQVPGDVHQRGHVSRSTSTRSTCATTSPRSSRPIPTTWTSNSTTSCSA